MSICLLVTSDRMWASPIWLFVGYFRSDVGEPNLAVCWLVEIGCGLAWNQQALDDQR